HHLADEARVLRGDGPQHGPGRSGLERGVHGVERSQPAAGLHGNGDPLADRRNDSAVVAGAERRVQVHHVQQRGAVGLEPPGHLYGVVAVDRLVGGVPAAQAHRPAAPKVDGRHDDHAATSFTKLSYRARPASPDFSGWNWVANSEPRATAAANTAPYSVSPTVTAG